MEPGLSHRPRFRQDLIAELIDDTADSGARFIDVMNPDSGHVFRFYEVEYSLACGMDGERDVSGLVKWAKDELGLTASTREVQSVIAALNDCGYLEPGTAITAAPVESARAAVPVETPAPTRAATQGQRSPQVARPSPAAGAVPTSTDRPAAVPELELGYAGPPPSAADTPIGPAADIELGSGILVGAPTQVAASQAVEDIALGQPGRADTVDDLGAQRGISAAGAKAATPTVGGPQEAAIELPPSRPEERPTRHPTQPQPAPHGTSRAGRTSDRPAQAEMPAAMATEPVAPPAAIASQAVADLPVPAAVQEVRRIEHALPAPVEDRRPAEPARPRTDTWRASQQLPPQRPVETEAPRPPAEPPEEPRVSRSVLALLAAAIVAAAAFVTYKVAVKKSDDQWAPPTAPVQPPPAHTPEPLTVEVQKLATSPELIESIKPASAGVIEKIHETAVTRGEVIVEFAGHKRIAAEIASLEGDIEKRIRPEIAAAQRVRDEAQAAGAPAGKLAVAEKRLADRQRSLADKQAKLAAKQLELEKLELRAPTDGRVTAQVAPGAKVTPTDDIAKLTHVSMRIATFKNAGGSPNTRVILVSTASGRRLRCMVAKVDANGTTITCPLDVAPESTEVTFGGIDTTPPPAAESEHPDNEQIQIDPIVPTSAGSGSGSNQPSSGVATPPAPPPPPGQTSPPPVDAAASGSGETVPTPNSQPAATPANPTDHPPTKPAESADTPSPVPTSGQ